MEDTKKIQLEVSKEDIKNWLQNKKVKLSEENIKAVFNELPHVLKFNKSMIIRDTVEIINSNMSAENKFDNS